MDILEKSLVDEDLGIRSSAAHALGNIGDEKAILLLRKAIGNLFRSDHYVASSLASYVNEKSIPLLEEIMKSDDYLARIVGCVALGQIGTQNALDLLKAAMPDRYDEVRGSATLALGQIGNDGAMALLVDAMKDGDKDVRSCATVALGDIGSGKAIELLDQIMEDANLDVSHNAFVALCRIGGDVAIDRIKKVLANEDSPLIDDAKDALEQIGGYKAILEKMIANMAWSIHKSEFDSFGRVCDSRVKALLEVELGKSSKEVRRGMFTALGDIGGEMSRDVLLKYLAQEQSLDNYRIVVAILKEKFGDDPLVQGMLKNTVPPPDDHAKLRPSI